MSNGKRRRVFHMTSEQVAVQGYHCAQCGNKIVAGSLYERKIYTMRGFRSARSGRLHPDRLVAEHTHLQPSCWESDRWH